uniref:Uncharacterized protein n=1 Tax=Rhizophora mucronata TaxID=61149 RepID=A0A2P2LVM1_RHIMU
MSKAHILRKNYYQSVNTQSIKLNWVHSNILDILIMVIPVKAGAWESLGHQQQH